MSATQHTIAASTRETATLGGFNSRWSAPELRTPGVVAMPLMQRPSAHNIVLFWLFGRLAESFFQPTEELGRIWKG